MLLLDESSADLAGALNEDLRTAFVELVSYRLCDDGALVGEVVTAGSSAPGVDKDLDLVLAEVNEILDQREKAGEEMVQRWLTSQKLPGIQALIEKAISRRLKKDVNALLCAVADGDVDAIDRAAHSAVGWTGSYKLTEIADPVRVINSTISAPEVDMDLIRRRALELGSVYASVPRRYLVVRDGEGEATPIDLSVGKVLVVDDNDANLALIEILIRERGLGCDLARNGKVALEMMRRRSYDLVLLDMEMPVQDGWITIDLIRKDPDLKDTPVVAVTAHALTGAAERCLEAGCDAQLPKPFTQRQLFEVVSRWLGGRESGHD